MPKLSSDLAQKTAEAEGGNFEPLPEDTYLAVLEKDVDVESGPNGPYWKWTFVIPEGKEFAGRKLWTNTSLSEKALWKLKEVFEAFGVSTDYDTEDLVGKPVKLVVVQKVQEKGNKAGDLVNEVRTILPASDDVAAKATKTSGTAPARDDVPLY